MSAGGCIGEGECCGVNEVAGCVAEGKVQESVTRGCGLNVREMGEPVMVELLRYCCTIINPLLPRPLLQV